MRAVQTLLDFLAPGAAEVAVGCGSDAGAVGVTSAPILRMVCESDDATAVRDMVEAAQVRGWGGLRVSGSPAFCRQVWLEGRLRGIPTQGYEPTADDWSALAVAQGVAGR